MNNRQEGEPGIGPVVTLTWRVSVYPAAKRCNRRRILFTAGWDR